MEDLHAVPNTVVMLNIRYSVAMDVSAPQIVEDAGAVTGIVWVVHALIVVELGLTKLEIVEASVSNTNCWDIFVEFIEANVAVAPVKLDNEFKDADAELLNLKVEITFTGCVDKLFEDRIDLEDCL
jgi:hypothetical protein